MASPSAERLCGKFMRRFNHRKAYRYVKECIGQGKPLDEKIVKDIHALLMENIQTGGVYRDVQVYISGARHMPPPPELIYDFFNAFKMRQIASTSSQLNSSKWSNCVLMFSMASFFTPLASVFKK